MTDIDDGEIEFREDLPETPLNQAYTAEVYKKWFKAGGQQGFLSITPWLAAGKFTVDIGKVDPNTKSVLSSTKCYVNAINLNVYLQAFVMGKSETLYPMRKDCPSPESLVVYGGSGKSDPPVSRIFKIHYWGAKKDSPGNASGFAWKCGHFVGDVGETGAVMPKYDQPIGADMIKVSLLEMHEIAYRLDTAMKGHAAKFNNWYES